MVEERKRSLISVVMCTYNGLPYLVEAVDAILGQSYSNIELVISDDCSTDGTREWLTSKSAVDQRIRLFLQPKNLGYVPNKNFAHSQARGQYITQMDQDDLSAPDRIEVMMNVIQQNSSAKIVACNYRLIDDKGVVTRGPVEADNQIITKRPDGEYPFWFPSLLCDADVIRAVGPFNTYFAGALGDDYYWTSLAVSKFPIHYINKPMYDYRVHPSSITGQISNMRKMVMPYVLLELMRQRDTSGTDWLEQNDFESLSRLEKKISTGRSFLLRHYQIAAARCFDRRQFSSGFGMVWKGLLVGGVSKESLKTLWYGVRCLFTETFSSSK
ncbi:MAG: glycosyltransferase [Chryseolinea sp.]